MMKITNNSVIGNLVKGAMMMLMHSSVEAALSPNAVLQFDAPVIENGQVVSGSNFGIDFTSDGVIDIFERTGLTSNDGLKIGTAQSATPQLPGIDQPWNFFAIQGVHQTTSPVTILNDDGNGNVELDFSGWAVNWNGVDVKLGGSAWGSNQDGVANMTCSSDCSVGDSFSLFYTSTVTEGPFIGIRYRLGFDSGILASLPLLSASNVAGGPVEDYGVVATGTIGAVPIPAAVWLLSTGLVVLFSASSRKEK